MKKPIVIIKNRPLGHYLLSIFSWFLYGEEEVLLKSYGSINGKTADIANLIAYDIIPYTFNTAFENSVEEIESIGHFYKASALTANLKLQKAKIEEFEVKPVEISESETISQFDICELEILLNLICMSGISKIQLNTKIEGESITIGQINLAEHKLIINDELLKISGIVDKRTKVISKSRSSLINALMRASILKPNIERYEKIIAQWDDVILGLDTNLFYSCAITSFLLDSFLKIPSGDFIDSPDWMTLVLSKVAMGEIENRSSHAKVPSVDRRESLRAIQEIMIINKSKDLEGVSMFLTGAIPPGISFTSGETTTIRDSIIREQFKSFLKSMDFYKGSYFLTQDFNNATSAEAEGLVALYIQKPSLEQEEYNLLSDDKINASEIIYELSVAFQPLIIETDGVILEIESNWQGKSLKNWEDWQIRIKWVKDEMGLRANLEYWKKRELVKMIMLGWQNLKDRYVSWIK